MMEALNSVNFDKEKDTLVNVGDPFDRGPSSKEVLNYFLSCPNRILIWGNHDARLNQLIVGSSMLCRYDFDNGVPQTIMSFTGLTGQVSLTNQIFMLRSDPTYRKIANNLFQYFRECVWAVEFDDLIATHAWLPVYDDGKKHYSLPVGWENTNRGDWYEATWVNSAAISKCPAAYPDKKLLIGHWHAWDLAEKAGERRCAKKLLSFAVEINCDTYFSADGKLIAIDGCAAWPKGGKVNAFVYESDKEPKIYR